jgi:Lipocalin-like domain
VAAQSPRAVANQLVGTWRLVSASQRMADGTVRPDPQTGPQGTGYIMYSDTGRMCAVLANPDRPKWKAEAAPADAEVRAAFDGLLAYCGTYDVNDAEGYVVHHIELDRVPNLSGTDRKRYFTLDGPRLVLRPAPPLPAGVVAWTVEWERVTGK